MIAIGLLADDDAPRDTGPDFGKASPFGLVIVVLLLIGTFLLVWSMNQHLQEAARVVRAGQPRTDQDRRRREAPPSSPDLTTEDHEREPAAELASTACP